MVFLPIANGQSSNNSIPQSTPIILSNPTTSSTPVSSSGSFPLQLDTQGIAQYSHHNFTDIKNPYDGIDEWMEVRATYWLDSNSKQFGVYANFLFSITSEEEFWWQNNTQFGGGIQFYPLPNTDTSLLRGIRLFAWAGWRYYYDKPDDTNAQDNDIQVGLDYYYDNIFNYAKNELISEGWLAGAAYMTATYRNTNFSLVDYNGFILSGNIKLGPRITCFPALFPYAVADWTYSPSYHEHWWENFLRVGGGLRFYPIAALGITQNRGFVGDLLARLNVFVEVLHNVAWLEDKAPDIVEKTDIRIGIAFSTGVFTGDRNSDIK